MEKKVKKAVIVEDGNLYRVIGLEERAEVGFIHKYYPAHNMKRYFTKMREFHKYEILNIEPFMEKIEERLKELE